MRQSLAKGTRRDLRRAIGPDVLKAVQGFDQSIGLLQNGLVTAQREIATLALNHAALKDTLRVLDAVQTSERGKAVEPLSRTFSGRLRWLFTGA